MFTKNLSFLSTEIQQRKRKREEEKEPEKKFIKRGELDSKREQEYFKKNEEKIAKQKEKEDQKMKDIELTYKIVSKEEAKETKEPVLPRDEVIRRLKARDQPITLFGEDDAMRAERLQQLELKEPMEYIKSDTSRWEGSDFLKTLKEQEDDEEDIQVQKKKKEEEEDPDFKIEDREPTCKEEEVLFFCRARLQDMKADLNSRSLVERNTARGRKESTTHQQTKAFIRPLFKMCKHKAVPVDILKELVNIVRALSDKNYVKANDAYYRMAIGNSPWPMGVTMVGIHERSAREKISTSDQARIHFIT